MSINWYPGHMVKAKREMEDNLKLVDLCVQVLDARAPLATQNPDLEQMTQHKPIVTVLNKADLADDAVTKLWVDEMGQDGNVIAFTATKNRESKKLLTAITHAAEPIVA
ncbi:ribosome biogenesis GTPase YlqF, partial [Eubacteriales bacterium OttesenSCG-928-N14]|nr:ribosome biogenesis GTPase YlqF [Eubacteriales bacterium OttesenSCG-928-N14]